MDEIIKFGIRKCYTHDFWELQTSGSWKWQSIALMENDDTLKVMKTILNFLHFLEQGKLLKFIDYVSGDTEFSYGMIQISVEYVKD